MLVSAVQQRKSAIIIHISLPSWASLPYPHPTPLGHHRVSGWLPVLYSNISPAICFTHGSVYMSMLLSPFVPLSPSPTVSTSPFHLRILYFPANRFALYIFKSISQLFCRMTLSLRSSNISSWLDLGYAILARIPQKQCYAFSACHAGSTISMSHHWWC